jgi:formylglycine-generating enzyme required for sulfatase activity
VRLDPEAWDRLVTWIDLNAPCHGSWGEVAKIPISNQPERRRFLRTLYGGIDEDAERTPLADAGPVEPVMPEPVKTAKTEPPACPGWPFSAVEAAQRQQALGPVSRRLDLGGGVTLELVRIPAGRFVMGDAAGDADEQPLCAVEVERPFWLGKFEVTNEQYSQFDPSHDSRFEHRSSWIFHAAYLGWPLNRPRQPVVRVSWNEAMAFCKWLSHKTGQRVTLPTEAQWEYACRAGASTPLGYGDLDTDFAKHANMADETLRNLAYDGWRPRPPDLVPRDRRFNDGALVTTEVGHYLPNAWGVHDLHGNAAEWTRDEYRPYPPSPQASDRPHGDDTLRVVRGGSWRDRPKRCRSAFRLGYPAYQKVFNVGFRVVLGDQPEEKWAGAPALTQPSR